MYVVVRACSDIPEQYNFLSALFDEAVAHSQPHSRLSTTDRDLVPFRMSLALFLRSRRCLMQFDSATKSLAASRPAVKRSFSQQAAQAISPSQATPPPAKLPRAGNLSGDSSPISVARGHTSKSAMSSLNHRKQSRPSSDAGPSTQSHRGLPGPSRGLGKSKHGKKGGVRGIPRGFLEGPYHTEQYIEQEHHKSPIPLKPLHKEAPKSSLNNFCQLVKGKLPEYVSEQGTIMNGNNPVRIWRQVEPSQV